METGKMGDTGWRARLETQCAVWGIEGAIGHPGRGKQEAVLEKDQSYRFRPEKPGWG